MLEEVLLDWLMHKDLYEELDLAFNNFKPKDWYFVLDQVQFRTGLGYGCG